MEMLHFPRDNSSIFPINMLFHFNFNSTLMDTSSPHQFQNSPYNPNPNPNLDRVAHDHTYRDHLDDALCFKDVSDYLMSDESWEEIRDLSRNKNIIDDQSSISACNIKRRRIMKKYNKEKQEFRIAFRTKSDLEIMDDGFKWRKYGKKMVKSSPNPRNYFKCSNGGCCVKKRVERDGNDSKYVITTYEGVHNHETPTCVLYCTPQGFSL